MTNRRTSFLGGAKAGDAKESGALIHKSVALSHVVFRTNTSQPASRSSFSNPATGGDTRATGKRKQPGASSSLFQKVASKGQ
jgi:hypothetical protein